jgi:hypothetical protein
MDSLSQREREEYLSLPALSQRAREYLLFAI